MKLWESFSYFLKSYTIELITFPSSLVLSSCIYIAAITIVPTHIDKSAILEEKKKKTLDSSLS